MGVTDPLSLLVPAPVLATVTSRGLVVSAPLYSRMRMSG